MGGQVVEVGGWKSVKYFQGECGGTNIHGLDWGGDSCKATLLLIHGIFGSAVFHGGDLIGENQGTWKVLNLTSVACSQ
jgi:hypothetical protein